MRRLLATSAGALALTLATTSCMMPAPPADPGPAQPVVEHLEQQEILMPLPLRVRLPARYGAERVLVFFHTWGSRDWDVLELARSGQTWTGAVSCRQVSTVTGDTKYFFVALDADGRTVVGSGSPEWPHVATIVGALPGGPQALPGDEAAARCHDVADCPPDFPGCPAYTLLRPPCDAERRCEGGEQCAWDGYCGPATMAEADAAAEANLTDDERLARAVRAATRRYQTAKGAAPPRGTHD